MAGCRCTWLAGLPAREAVERRMGQWRQCRGRRQLIPREYFCLELRGVLQFVQDWLIKVITNNHATSDGDGIELDDVTGIRIKQFLRMKGGVGVSSSFSRLDMSRIWYYLFHPHLYFVSFTFYCFRCAHGLSFSSLLTLQSVQSMSCKAVYLAYRQAANTCLLCTLCEALHA